MAGLGKRDPLTQPLPAAPSSNKFAGNLHLNMRCSCFTRHNTSGAVLHPEIMVSQGSGCRTWGACTALPGPRSFTSQAVGGAIIFFDCRAGGAHYVYGDLQLRGDRGLYNLASATWIPGRPLGAALVSHRCSGGRAGICARR